MKRLYLPSVCMFMMPILGMTSPGEFSKLMIEYHPYCDIVWQHLPKQTQVILQSEDSYIKMQEHIRDHRGKAVDIKQVVLTSAGETLKVDCIILKPCADGEKQFPGVVYMRSFAPICARDYEKLLIPLAVHEDAECVILAPQKFDVSTKDLTPDLWSDEWMNNLRRSYRFLDQYASC